MLTIKVMVKTDGLRVDRKFTRTRQASQRCLNRRVVIFLYHFYQSGDFLTK